MLAVITLAGCKKDKDPVDVNTCTVTFDVGGGTPVPPKQTVEAGGMAIEPQTNPEKQGYIFMFWHLSETSTAYDFQTPVNSNITLVAKWESKANIPYADYFGTWRFYFQGGTWHQIIISADKIEWSSTSGYFSTISGLTWTETENPGGDLVADYPTGYKVTGTFGMYNAYEAPKADGSGKCSKGDIALNTFYLSADKKSIARGNWDTAEQEGDRIFNKRTDIEFWQVAYNLNGGEWMPDHNFYTKVAKDGRVGYIDHPVKGDLVFEGWCFSHNGELISLNYNVNEIKDNITLVARYSSETYLQKAVYSMGYSIKISIEKPSAILDANGITIATVNYAGVSSTLVSADITGNLTYVAFWADGGARRPEEIRARYGSMLADGAVLSEIKNGTYNYARYSGKQIAIFHEYQPNNPYISLENLQKMTNNSAITQTIFDNIRGALPSYSYKMIVFGINSKKEFMGKYIGYTTDGKVYNYWCIDPASADFGKGILTMNSPIN